MDTVIISNSAIHSNTLYCGLDASSKTLLDVGFVAVAVVVEDVVVELLPADVVVDHDNVVVVKCWTYP